MQRLPGGGRALLEARDLSKRYFRKGRESARYFDAVAPCDIGLSGGEVVAVTGRSGSGKSTLLSMLAGLLEPSMGTVELEGEDLYALGDAKLSRLRNEAFGVVPQGHAVIHSLTVMGNATLSASLYPGDGTIEARARDLLDELGIADLAESYPHELSGGELRRVSIARALAARPRVVFADEPTGDLDDANTRGVLELLRRVADEGAAVLMVTHDAAATGIADRVLRMDAGRLLS